MSKIVKLRDVQAGTFFTRVERDYEIYVRTHSFRQGTAEWLAVRLSDGQAAFQCNVGPRRIEYLEVKVLQKIYPQQTFFENDPTPSERFD
ncbi:MAG: hypothetical protein A2854_00460 [Parcubacteria group bacterium RIFCSPHIGHO2_01_FULL_56_18]|nr:MAG: hypothetical protein A2854_00460 [Parcubacteria group bacterium RIFCSPHIGHO2_01_FULL_56_18]